MSESADEPPVLRPTGPVRFRRRAVRHRRHSPAARGLAGPRPPQLRSWRRRAARTLALSRRRVPPPRQWIELSVNALRSLLAPLKRPYSYDLNRWFFHFREKQWVRRYEARDLYATTVAENPEEADEVARALIRRMALVGGR